MDKLTREATSTLFFYSRKREWVTLREQLLSFLIYLLRVISYIVKGSNCYFHFLSPVYHGE